MAHKESFCLFGCFFVCLLLFGGLATIYVVHHPLSMVPFPKYSILFTSYLITKINWTIIITI